MIHLLIDNLSKHTTYLKTLRYLLSAVLISIVFAAIPYASASEKDVLTAEEHLWLNNNQSRIVLAVETGYPPFTFLDTNAQPTGLAHDYLLLIESKLGVHFKQRQFTSLDDIFAKARSGEVHIVNAVTKTPERSEFLSFTDPFISVPNVIVVRKERAGMMRENDLTGLKVSLVKSYAITEHLTKANPGIVADLVPNDLAAILNVSFSRSDAAVVDLATATYLIELKGITNLRVASEASQNIKLSIGVPQSEAILRDILQKGLAAITEADRRRIQDRWIHASSNLIFTDRRFWIATAGIALAIFSGIAGILVWNRTLRSQVALHTEDLTREKDALRQSGERHRSILQTAMDGIWLVDTHGRLLEVNQAYCEMSGYSEQELLAMTIPDLEVNETADDTEARIKNIMEQGKIRFESRHRRKDGTVIDVEVSVQFRPDNGGQCVAFLRDITERKRAQEALLETTNKITQLLQATDQGIYGIDVNSRCTFINESGLKMIGYDVEDCIGNDMHDLIHHRHANGLPYAKEECPILRAKISGVGCHVDSEVLWRKDGTSFPAEYSSYPIIENGFIRGAVVTISDITDRKRSEEDKTKLEYQLLQAQKMESVGRLAGGVAHDFNNMLTVILGHAELALLRADQANPLRNEILEIRSAAERSADLTRQLLAFARKQTISPKPMNLNDSIAAMLKMLQRLIGENVCLTWQPDSELWQIKADSSQIDQILTNLCVNAKDAIDNTGRITIETHNRTVDAYYRITHPYAVPGEYVRISVCDNGRGMDKETQSHIFEPFYTTKEMGKGTGLGLATVFGIVKQNNGFITVYSEPNHGSTFAIYFPRFEEKNAETLAEIASLSIPRGKETILLVEDEATILSVTTKMLEAQGYAVLTARTPGEAVQLAKEHAGAIHLLMTDVIMPEMNGRELATELLSTYPTMKCLFMSGYTADVISQHGVLGEGINFIQKPFSLTNMAATVRDVLNSR